jgi:hypothetical protein
MLFSRHAGVNNLEKPLAELASANYEVGTWQEDVEAPAAIAARRFRVHGGARAHGKPHGS